MVRHTAGPAKRAGPSEATRTGGGVTRPYTPAEASCQRPREPEAVPASLRTSPAFVRLTTVTAALTVVLVALGGAVRAFDAGLACPTWPGCFTAGDFVPPAVVTVWLEHTHRLVAGAVGLLLAAAFFWVLARYRSQRDLLWLSAAAAFIVVLQALLGALVVWQQLQAELVTAHLGLGTALLALELVLATRARHVPVAPLPAAQVRLARQGMVVAGLVWLQLLVGAHVTGVGSGLAFVEQRGAGRGRGRADRAARPRPSTSCTARWPWWSPPRRCGWLPRRGAPGCVGGRCACPGWPPGWSWCRSCWAW